MGGDVWRDWDGARDFRGDALLRVRFRNGRISKDALPAWKWRGKWGRQRKGRAFPDNYEFDITAVCVVSQD